MLLEFVLVSENDFSEGSASAGVVHNILNDSLDVTVQKGGDARMLDTPFLLSCMLRLLTLYAQRSPRF